MDRGVRSSHWNALGQRWQRWTDIVELFAHRRLARRKVRPREYHVLYQELLEKCQALEQASEDTEREWFVQLQEIVQPWLTVQSLNRADLAILHSLLDVCRQVSRRLGVDKRRWGIGQGAVRILVPMGLAGGIALAALTGYLGEPAWQAGQWVLEETAPFRAVLTSLGSGTKIFLCGLVVVGISLFLVSRTRESA
jgi:hypothetical protein